MMKRLHAYGLLAIVALGLLAALSVAQVTVYNPIEGKNVFASQVSMDTLKSWMSSPGFYKWTNTETLRDYLEEQGVDYDEFREEALGSDTRELLANDGRQSVVKRFDASSMYNEGEAVTEIECDLDDEELEFELTNVGSHNWFLVDQGLTQESDNPRRKQLSNALVQAKPIQFYVNNYPANSLLPKFSNGQKLFYPQGESFATACGADFLRMDRTVDCDLEPAPVKDSSSFENSYLIVAPGFSERGTFTCE
jgi:hypothetical protein